MYIISKFHDYYDSIKSYGIDKSCIYKREFSKHLLVNKSSLYHTQQDRYDRYKHDYNDLFNHKDCNNDASTFFIVGVAGKMYKGYRKDVSTKDTMSFEFLYGDEYVAKLYDEKKKTTFYWKPPFEKIKEYEKFFGEYNVPVFVVVDDYLFLNPMLCSIDFQKVLDPFTVYQNIYQFLSGVLGTQKEIPELSDKSKIEKHGFDKYSFRKGKTKKR